jgi:glycine dehydrogenase
MLENEFVTRHDGVSSSEETEMLKTIGVASLDDLMDRTIPSAIRLPTPLDLPEAMSEHSYLQSIKGILSKNKPFRSFIGMGYYFSLMPAVITRNIFENPTWYTSYTPYQAEISQGRLEALLNYQTMISELTALPLSNASLLDEATAAGELMLMFYNSRTREAVKNRVCKFFVSSDVFPSTIEVMKTNAAPLGIELVIGDAGSVELDGQFFGALVQYPDQRGAIVDFRAFAEKAKATGIFVGVACDLLSLTLLTPPGEWGADAAIGSTQRFGLPMGFGGPAAAFFACKEDFKRQMPGRVIGITVDASGEKAYRMALQTREQHIKREKATSNICTASALVAIMSGFYGMWYGPNRLKELALKVHAQASLIAEEAERYGYKQTNALFFDTLCFETPAGISVQQVRTKALSRGYNFCYRGADCFSIALDETTSDADLHGILQVLAAAAGKEYHPFACNEQQFVGKEYPESLQRKSEFMQQAIFHRYHSETAMMRYMTQLAQKDLSLNKAMIPLGSCTMKLNAAAELMPLSWAEAANVHPFAPAEQVEGYLQMINEMGEWLAKITGFKAVSFQPNSGAAGEYAGLTVIRDYHHSKGEAHRDVCLIPASAHGTNPASAFKAGNKIVVVKSTEQGEIDINDLKEKAEQYRDNLACLMVTYPSTHGVFEEKILDIIKIIHENGGQVYMDGANMNAQVGLTSPGFMGADVCHLNLHKTFAMPHGGGGPGVGPIAVAEHLVNFLPKHAMTGTGGKEGSQVSAAPYGSAFLLPITYAYLKMLGGKGLTEATRHAILNANYLRAKLEKHYKILYTGTNGMCAHEMILDCNAFEKSAGVQVGDIAKRLMDYGFHAPTVAFPVHGTLMVEPTESEPLSELDRFCEAMISIRDEIREIEDGIADRANNVFKNAPHTCNVVCASEWDKPYSREKAAFPLSRENKYWPASGRVDDAFGDRNLVAKV